MKMNFCITFSETFKKVILYGSRLYSLRPFVLKGRFLFTFYYNRHYYQIIIMPRIFRSVNTVLYIFY